MRRARPARPDHASTGTVLSLLALGLLWAPSVMRYCRRPHDAMPAARAPDGP
jgi:hypothetical protein